MPTYSISETEVFNRTSTISDEHFGVNFVTHSDFEFAAGSQQVGTLASLGASNFRFPGGGITEGDFANASFLTGNWAADSYGSRTLTPLSNFFATAGEVNAEVQLVIPTRVAFDASAGQSLWNLDQGSTGEHYGARTTLDPNYFTLLASFIDQALMLATQNGVEISSFEIGNEFWLGGEMTASEYGYLAGQISAWLDANYPGIDILVQATNTIGIFSPYNNETVYLEAFSGEGGETDYTVHTSPPDGVSVTSATVASQGNWSAQTRDIARAIAENPDGVAAIDGVLFHNYFDDGFAGIDTEDEVKLELVYDRFASFSGRSDLEFHITEWSPDTNNDSGLQNAQSYVEGFFELIQWGVDGADAWPLTYANPGTRGRNLIDTGDAISHLTFAGVAFQWLSESTVGLEAKYDYEVAGQIDVHGFGNSNRMVAFVGERSGNAQANTIVDFNSFAVNGDYFVVVSTMGDGGASGTSNTASPILSYSGGAVVSGGLVTLDLEAWDLARIEMTAVTNGADALIGRGGNDTITAGAGNDTIEGGHGTDSLYGQSGNDHILGGTGDDLLEGGDNNDILNGQEGADTLIGGSGSDRFVIEAGDEGDIISDFAIGHDQIDIGSGAKTVVVASHQDGVSLTVSSASFVVHGLNIADISSAIFTNYGDQITVEVDSTPSYTTVEIGSETNTYGTSGVAETFQWVATSAAGARLRVFDAGEDIIDLSYWQASDFSALTFTAGTNFLNVTFGEFGMRLYGYTDPAELGSNNFVFDGSGGGTDPSPAYTTVEISAETNTYGTSGVAESFQWVETSAAGARLRDFDVGEDVIDLTYWQASDFFALTLTAGSNFLSVTDGQSGMRVYGYTDPAALGAEDFIFGTSGGGGDPQPGGVVTVEIGAQTNTYGTHGVEEVFEWVATSAAGARLRNVDSTEDTIDLTYWQASSVNDLSFTAGSNYLLVSEGGHAMRIYGYTDASEFGQDFFVFG